MDEMYRDVFCDRLFLVVGEDGDDGQEGIEWLCGLEPLEGLRLLTDR